MASMPEHGSAEWAAEESVVSRVNIRVNLIPDALLLIDRQQRRIAANATAEEASLGVQVQGLNHCPELSNRIGVSQKQEVCDRGELVGHMPVAGYKDSPGGIGLKDQVMGAQSDVPCGIISGYPQVLAQPDDHVIHGEPRPVNGRIHVLSSSRPRQGRITPAESHSRAAVPPSLRRVNRHDAESADGWSQ
jgi:hypothetical protein